MDNDSGSALLTRIAALEVERARIEAEIASVMVDFADLRRREAEQAPNATVRELEASFAADELALVLLQPTRTVQCRLAAARRVRSQLPQTWLAFLSGAFDGYRLSLIASTAAGLADPVSLAQLDTAAAGYAASHTAAQLKAWLRRQAARLEPDRLSERATAEREQRRVFVDHQDDGMSYLTAYLPTVEAVEIDRLLTSRARAGTADGRTVDQRRADAFADQMLGRADGNRPSGGATIAVTIPVMSLAGLTNQPGSSFDGQFALPAEVVRDLAAEPGTLFHRIVTDPAGGILDVTEFGRFPSPALRIAVQARDGTCVFPTCSRPSVDCDLDHQVPHPRGPTSGANLRPLCRRHHRMKTFGVTDPADLTVHRRYVSRLECDLATWATPLRFAA